MTVLGHVLPVAILASDMLCVIDGFDAQQSRHVAAIPWLSSTLLVNYKSIVGNRSHDRLTWAAKSLTH